MPQPDRRSLLQLRQAGLVLLCATVLLSSSALQAQPVIRMGAEFQVNSYTAGVQNRPAATSDSDGDFVIVWESYLQDGAGLGVFARRFNAAGAPQGAEFQINSVTENLQRLPVVVSGADDDFIVVWESYLQDGDALGVFARRFDAAGVPQASEFQVNSYTVSQQALIGAASDGGGAFVVTWQSYLQDGNGFDIFARRFNAAGTAQGDEFQVNSYTQYQQRLPTVASDSDGDFVVVWESSIQDGDLYGIFARRFNATGSPQGAEFQINVHTANNQRWPRIASDAGGDFVVAWSSYGQDGSHYGVFARRFDAAGAAQATEFQVNTYTASYQFVTAIAADGNGGFVIAWQASGQDGSLRDIFARRFDSAGVPLGTEFQVNSYTNDAQAFATIASSGGGNLVVAWDSAGQDGSLEGIFAQRLKLLASLDVDGNGAVGALTDGLLVLRFQFGFSGATLTSGAIGGGCTRCDAASIQPYLTGLGLALDIDDNDSLAPLTDGLLILRFLFGFTGATLTNSAVASNCMRCDATTILPYLETLD